MHPIEDRLRELGIDLPIPPSPVANYVPHLVYGNQLLISGQLPTSNGAVAVTGRIGEDLTIDDGRLAARLCAINILAQARAALGGFDRLERLLKLSGFVNASFGFGDHPKVINGASDFMVEVLGERGRHTRVAVGASGLPLNAAVEIEALFGVN